MSDPDRSATARSSAVRHGLDRASVTAAAVDLLDEVGLSGLSTRRLADKLGVRSPTLYWHVRNKDELLDLVAESICAGAFSIDESASWRDQLMSGLRQFRELLLAHRDAAQLLRLRPATGPVRLGHVETTVRILVSAGFSDTDAAAVARLLASHVLDSVATPSEGATVPAAERGDDLPHLTRVAAMSVSLTDADVFELGCGIILDGLEARAQRT